MDDVRKEVTANGAYGPRQDQVLGGPGPLVTPPNVMELSGVFYSLSDLERVSLHSFVQSKLLSSVSSQHMTCCVSWSHRLIQ